MVDLWPDDFGSANIITPVSILREQASKLGEKTKNVVEAQVIEAQERPFWANSGDFTYNFYLVAPLLKGYRYKLLVMSYSITMYPVKIGVDTDIAIEVLDKQPDIQITPTAFERVLFATSEEEYISLLGLIFNSPKARNIISAILAHSAQ